MKTLLFLLALAPGLYSQAATQQILISENISAGGGAVVTWNSSNVGKENVSDGVLAFPMNTTAGSLLIVGWDSDSTGTSITGCTDTQSNPWVLSVTTVDSGPTWQGQIFKAVNTAGGADTVTCNLGGAAVFGDMWVLEYLKNSGSPPDVVSSASAIEMLDTIGPVTTTLASAQILIVGSPSDGGTTACTASPSGTLVSSNSVSGNSVAYLQTMTAGAADNYSGTSCPPTVPNFFSHWSMVAIQ